MTGAPTHPVRKVRATALSLVLGLAQLPWAWTKTGGDRTPRELAAIRPLVLDAPSNLGLRPPAPGRAPGAAKLASALRKRGLIERLGAEDAGVVPAPAYSPDPDAETWFRNGAGLRDYSQRLADRVSALVGQRRFVLVLGGDCSVLIGSMLGLRSLGRHGLVFIDGHDDFSPARRLEEYKGRLTAAGLDLAIVTGHAPGGLDDLRGRRPYVREEDVALFGFTHSAEDSRDFATERLNATRMHRTPASEVRSTGAAWAARASLAALDLTALEGVWVHLDADVLDSDVMPAVDSPNPHGLSFDELREAMAVFLAEPKVVGLEVTIYDPDLDPGGAAGDRLAATLVDALAAAGRTGSVKPASAPGETLEPGSPGVDARRIPAYTNLWEMFEVGADGAERFVGTWEDQVDIVSREGRPVLRRIQNARVGERTSAHLDEVDQRTLQPLRARYESNGRVLADATYEGHRLKALDIVTPVGMSATERMPVTLAVEFPRPVFDWHLWGVLLASFPLADGYQAAFLAHTTSDADAPLLRRFTLAVVGRETVALAGRDPVECYVVRIDAGVPWTFWISTTRRPVPVVQLKIEQRDGIVRWWKPPRQPSTVTPAREHES